MSPTRRPSSQLAGPRHGLAGAWAVLLLALAVVSVHVLCSVHLDEQAQGAGHSHAASALVSVDEAADEAAGDAVGAPAVPEPAGGDSHGCSDHHQATAECDPVLPVPAGSAVLPDLTVRWQVPEAAHHASRVGPNGTVAAAPSLHALGISRT
ncbi:hypothetical protein ACIGB8_19605 [Promicromonospora sukumoe]|uniref:hypothetical protein n=1 Tax=Promicromonospora sukumoe TaxID=88382 RepID=UPI0037CCB915